MTNTPVPSLKEFVHQRVHEHWTDKSKPVLLARLGQAAIAAGINLRVALGDRKFADFINEELRGDIQVEPSTESPPHLQARPVGLTNDAAAAEDEGAKHETRLHRALWLAFSRPISPGYSRRLQLEPVVRFWDLQPPMTEVAGRLPIESRYIAPPEEALSPQRRDDVVMENIRRWMRDNALDISKFEAGTAHVAAIDPRRATRNPLLQFMAALDAGELRRVSLPLDIIAKLLKK